MKRAIEKFFSLFSRKRNSWVETAQRDVAKPENTIPLDPNAPWNS